MENTNPPKVVTTPVLLEFGKLTLLWFIPSLVVFPIAFVGILIAVVALEDDLLCLFDTKFVGIFTALGPLLLLSSGIVFYLLIIDAETEIEEYLYGVLFSLLLLGIGVYLIRKSLQTIARKLLIRQRRTLFD